MAEATEEKAKEAPSESKGRSRSTKAEVGGDAGQAELQKRADERDALGFTPPAGRVDPFDDDAYSVQTGPESPTRRETHDALIEREASRRRGEGGES